MKSNKLSGLTFVFTGTLKQLSRDEAKEKVENLGGHTSESVSSKTDYLVSGNNPGSKLNRAEESGSIKIIDEETFLKLIGKK